MRLTLLILFLCLRFSAQSQLSVKIEDSESGLAVIGAKVVLTDGVTTSMFKSDNYGWVKLNTDSNKEIKIEVSAIGYDTLRQVLSPAAFQKKDTLRIQLFANRLFDAVLVTAQYAPTIVNNAIQKATIISSEQIEKSGAMNLMDILAYQTGIRLSQDNVLGSSMSLGGLSGQNVKILIDGIPVIGRQDGNIDLSQINLSNVERIEIIEGPLSVNYGTNALAGTINLITKKNPKKSIQVSVNPYYESIGNFNLTGSVGMKLKQHGFNFSGGRNFFDGWSATDDYFELPKSRPADTNRFKTWKPKEQYFFEGRYTTQIKSWNISPYVRHFDEMILNRGLPLAPYSEVGLDDYYHTLRQDAGINLNGKFKTSTWNTILAYNQFTRQKNTYVKDLTTLEQVLSEAQGAQDTSRFNLINLRSGYVKTFSEKLSLETGIDFNYETAYGRRISGLEKNQGDYAVFVTSQWELFKGFQIKPGIRYAHNTAYESPLTPSFNVLYKLENWRFRGSFARGFRAPTLKELYFDFVDINHNIQGNPDLKSEFSFNYSVGASWLKQIDNRYLLQVDYSAFYNDIENLITLGVLPDGSLTYINLGLFRSLGNQLKFSAKSNRLTTTIAATVIGRYNRLSTDATEVDPYSLSPEASVNFSYDLIKNRLGINTFYKFNGPLRSYSLVDNEIINNRQDAYSILDMSLSARFFDQQLLVIVGAKNILNVKEVNVVGFSGGAHSGGGNFNAARGSSVFVSLKYNFGYDFKQK